MNDETNSAQWAQLVSVTDVDSSAVIICKDTFVIGRNNDCDLSYEGNKLVSGRHCYIQRDDNQQVWLYDTSTNGTLLNLRIKLSKGECRELQHGDEIHVLHQTSNPEKDIGYMYQNMEALKAETSSELDDTQEYSLPQDQANATLACDDVNEVCSPSPVQPTKRKSEESPAVQRKKVCSDPLSTGTATEKPPESEVATAKPPEPEDDAIAETLICIICQELLHDCISLQPCMHSFCAGCYSDWMERSKECPSCRLEVQRINKNHIVNNLVDAYLKIKPEKKRSDDDLKELNSKNKITRDMLYPTTDPKGCESESDADYSEEDEAEEAGEDDDTGTSSSAMSVTTGNNLLFGLGTPFFGATQIASRQLCRQCPNYNAKTTGAGGLFGGLQQAFKAVGNLITGAGPSTAVINDDEKIFPTTPFFTCAGTQNHVLCLCCMQPMPDRRAQYTDGGAVPPQQCAICYRSYCHAYFGCHKVDCSGCLAKFKDFNFGKKCLTSLILDNTYESNVFKDYLANKDISVKELWADCVAKMVTGEYACTDQVRLTHGINTPLCYSCALRSFKEMAYQYRKAIPIVDLHVAVTRRPNCYWGKNCRTQRSKPEHAQRFNHICDQSRDV